MLLPYFEWLEALPVGLAIRESRWLFPVIEAIHLVAFAIAGGTVLLVSLRLLGYRLGGPTPSEVASDVRPWFIGSLAIALTSGLLLFLSEAVKCYNSAAFQIKIAALFAVIVLTVSSHRRVTADATPRGIQRAAAVTTLMLWGLVAWGGRWIGLG